VAIVLMERRSQSALALAVLEVGGVHVAEGFEPGWVLQSAGRNGALLRFTLATRPVVVLAIAAGSWFGMTGAALGYAASTAVVWPLGLWWVGRVAGAPARALLGNGVRAFVSHGLGAACAALAAHLLPAGGPSVAVAVRVAVWAAVLGVQALLWRRLRGDLGVLRRAAGLVVRRSSASSSASPSEEEEGS